MRYRLLAAVSKEGAVHRYHDVGMATVQSIFNKTQPNRWLIMLDAAGNVLLADTNRFTMNADWTVNMKDEVAVESIEVALARAALSGDDTMSIMSPGARMTSRMITNVLTEGKEPNDELSTELQRTID